MSKATTHYANALRAGVWDALRAGISELPLRGLRSYGVGMLRMLVWHTYRMDTSETRTVGGHRLTGERLSW